MHIKQPKRVNACLYLWQRNSFRRYRGVSDWEEIPSEEQKHSRLRLRLRPFYGKGLSGAFPAKGGIYQQKQKYKQSQLLHFQGIAAWSSLIRCRLIEAFLFVFTEAFHFLPAFLGPTDLRAIIADGKPAYYGLLTICHSLDCKNFIFCFLFKHTPYPNAEYTFSDTKRGKKKAAFEAQKREGQPAGSTKKDLNNHPFKSVILYFIAPVRK